jgi:hypothetical protein
MTVYSIFLESSCNLLYQVRIYPVNFNMYPNSIMYTPVDILGNRYDDMVCYTSMIFNRDLIVE